MTKKIFSFLLALMCVISFTGISKASADVYPAGCSSTMGYSSSGGTPCNGTTSATLYPTSTTTINSPFPGGCTSALGYSITTGQPCNGTGTVTNAFLPGCTTALGYSTTNGVPCSGGTTVLQYLAGCTAITGYSTINGAPCNGTGIATPVVTVPIPVDPGTAPGFPTTGAGGNSPINTLALIISGALSTLGVVYLVRRESKKA
jgi:hypothetical protein